MKLRLPSGKEVRVWVKHEAAFYNSHINEWRRGTSVYYEDGTFTTGALSLCRPPDQFCKAVGRRLAANKLLRNLRADNVVCRPYMAVEIGKRDRRALFLAINPQFGKTEAVFLSSKPTEVEAK